MHRVMAERRREGEEPRFALALALAFASSSALPAPGLAVECRTSRARSEIEAVTAATLAWYEDLTSGAHATPAPHRGALGPLCSSSPAVDLSLVPPIHWAILGSLLVPDYMAAVPSEDPWGHPYEYRLDVAEPLSADLFSMRSAGSDGLFDDTVYDVRWTSGPADDLVTYDFVWIRDVPRLDPVSRQRVTVEQVREVGRAIYSRWVDIVSCISSDDPFSFAESGTGEVDLSEFPPMSAADLATLLSVPLLYTRCVPELDGWGAPYDYRVYEEACPFPGHIGAIRSLGSDALAEGDLYSIGTFPADDRHRDIVWADAQMIREPDASGVDIFLDGFESGELWGYWSCAPGI